MIFVIIGRQEDNVGHVSEWEASQIAKGTAQKRFNELVIEEPESHDTIPAELLKSRFHFSLY